MLIINADDFGLSDAVNHGILLCFERGYCSSATVMPVAPAFLQACQLAHEKRLSHHIGLHAALSDGIAFSDLLKRQPRFCDPQGKLIFKGHDLLMPLAAAEKEAIADELRCQIEQCRKQGISPTHIDTHCHVHQIWSIASVVIAVARQMRIPYIRIKQNAPTSMRVKQFLYTYLFNMRLRVLHLARTRYAFPLEGIIDHIDFSRVVRLYASLEINIHPFVNAQGVLMNRYFETEHALDAQMRALENMPARFSYSGHSYAGVS